MVNTMAETAQEQEVKHIVRIANTDMTGKKSIGQGLTKIKGVGFMFANLICNIAQIDRSKLAGVLSNDELQRIEKILADPVSAGAPHWMLNRRFDPEDGEHKHLISTDLKFTQDNDVKTLKKIKSFRGIRHALGIPLRGQRTRSNFRKNKGKVTGVKKKK